MGIEFQAVNANETEDHGRFGVHPLRVSVPGFEEISLHLSYSVARAVFRFLDLEIDLDGGDRDIPTIRRAIVRARALGNAAEFGQPYRIEYAPPRENSDGSIEMRPPRLIDCGLDAERILRHVDTIESYLVAAADLGATHLTWA
jgi:hypothetical protein